MWSFFWSREGSRNFFISKFVQNGVFQYAVKDFSVHTHYLKRRRSRFHVGVGDRCWKWIFFGAPEPVIGARKSSESVSCNRLRLHVSDKFIEYRSLPSLFFFFGVEFVHVSLGKNNQRSAMRCSCICVIGLCCSLASKHIRTVEPYNLLVECR